MATRPLLDSKPVGGLPVRRCPGLRDRFGHHLDRRPHGLLGEEDGPVAAGQAHREGGRFVEERLVGSGEQAHDARGQCPADHPRPVPAASLWLLLKPSSRGRHGHVFVYPAPHSHFPGARPCILSSSCNCSTVADNEPLSRCGASTASAPSTT